MKGGRCSLPLFFSLYCMLEFLIIAIKYLKTENKLVAYFDQPIQRPIPNL